MSSTKHLKGQKGFQFKQFLVKQDRTAMKVCTDACLLGAYASADAPQRLLDIGAGTGLLGLMLAQRYPEAYVDCVEIDEDAASQCRENIDNSPFQGRMSILKERIQDFVPAYLDGYDLIVSNPPFYPDYLPSSDEKRRMAMHADKLMFSELSQCVSRLLHSKGSFFLLLPPVQAQQFKQEAIKNDLHCIEEMLISDSPEKMPIRSIALYKKEPQKDIKIHTFYIKSHTGEYSQEFITLLLDYYIIF